MRFFTVLSVSALFLLAFAPAVFAQDAVANDDSIATGGDVQYVDCSQVQAAVQAQYGDANAIGDENVAAVASEQGITQNQVNACLGNIGGGTGGNTPTPGDDDGDGDDGDKDGGGGGGGDDAASAARLPEGEDEVKVGTVLAKELPNTGGPSLLGGALGLTLVVVGSALIRSRR